MQINKKQHYCFQKMKQSKKPDQQFLSPNNRSPDNHNDHLPFQHNTTKNSSGSLNKYNKSPYLQKFSQGFALPRKQSNNIAVNDQQPNSRVKQVEYQQVSQIKLQRNQPKLSRIKKVQVPVYSSEKKEGQRSKSNMSISTDQRDKAMKFKLPKLDINVNKTDKKEKVSNNTLSATLEVTTKKKKLLPLSNTFRTQIAVKTKAGTNGNQTKINQDIAIIQTNLPHGVKLFCVCDGHGLNGHLVSAYIKQNLIKNLISALKKHAIQPQKIEQIFEQCLAQTNDGLLNSDINTQLSGSTVIAVFVHKQTIYSFNIGDSRAILVSQQANQVYKVIPLSDDQKPTREDQRLRILKFGGRVEAQKNERGQILGPLRVWMKDIQMPGLAMTRSFGDKAGIKAGTHGEPQLKMHKIRPQDKYMVIASDGVWQYLQNQQIMNIVNPFYKKYDLDLAAQKIMRISTQIWHKISYSRDDITVIIASLNPPSCEVNERNIQQKRQLKYTEIRQ